MDNAELDLGLMRPWKDGVPHQKRAANDEHRNSSEHKGSNNWEEPEPKSLGTRALPTNGSEDNGEVSLNHTKWDLDGAQTRRRHRGIANEAVIEATNLLEEAAREG